MKIITQQIYQAKSKKTQQDLTSILTKWNVGGKTPQTSQEFLNKMGPWINKQIDQEKELKEFFKQHKIKSLASIVGVKTKGG